MLLNDLRSRINLWQHFKVKLLALWPDIAIDLDEVDCNRLAACLRSLPMHVTIPVIKTYTNSWATSTRYHEKVRETCIFGCLASDCLSHYFRCEYLWHQLTDVTGTCTGNNDVAARLGIVDYSVSNHPGRDVYRGLLVHAGLLLLLLNVIVS